MTSTLLLAGSGEFRPPMVAVDRELLELTPGRPARVAIVPTAAGLELSVESWIRDGVSHFSALGCEAYGVYAIDRASADDPENAATVESADLIYLSGGSPGYLVTTLRDSLVWRAVQTARRRGSTLAGSSAGAMAQGGLTLAGAGRMSGGAWSWVEGLGVLPGIGVIPHYDRMGPARATPIAESAPAGLLVYGIDEDTAVLIQGRAAWVRGRGTVTLWQNGVATLFRAGDQLPEVEPST
jgi:cyanophycinase